MGEALQLGKVCNGFSAPLQIFRGEVLQWGDGLQYNTGNKSMYIGILCIFEIQWMHGKSSSSSLVFIPNVMRADSRLSSNSDAEKSVRLLVGSKEVS